MAEKKKTDLHGTDIRETALKGAKKVEKNEKGYLEAELADGIVMIFIPAGEFTMGSNDGSSNERPEHKVFLDGYWIGKYEVTCAQYDKYCQETGSEKPDDAGWGRGERPVINVSWEDAVAFCRWLSNKTGSGFSLPTEAQWEKAARGTEGLIYPFGSEFDKSKCNSEESNLQKTSPVGEFPAGVSPYGCADMAGNVWEWCSDWYKGGYYKDSPPGNPAGPDSGSYRVIRGGSFGSSRRRCRACYRRFNRPATRSLRRGFRLVINSPE